MRHRDIQKSFSTKCRCRWSQSWNWKWIIYVPYGRLHITWWCHQMETFSALLAICAGNSPVTSEYTAQRTMTRSFDVFLDLRLNKRLSKQSWGCDLRSHRAHYDVTAIRKFSVKTAGAISWYFIPSFIKNSRPIYNVKIKVRRYLTERKMYLTHCPWEI